MREIDSNRHAAKAILAKAHALLRVQIERVPVVMPLACTSGGLSSWQIRRILAFVESNLDKPIRVDELSRMVNLSRCHFARSFRRSFRESPHSYLIRRRVEHAGHLMLTSDICLSELAQVCGFADQAHLSRKFRERFGQSPAAWRRERKDRARESSAPTVMGDQAHAPRVMPSTGRAATRGAYSPSETIGPKSRHPSPSNTMS
jgi:AraC family transcriptional regulator